MSSFKKNTLAAALVLGMGLAGSAAAYTILTSGNVAPENVATQSGSTFVMTEAVEIRTDLGDAVIGRTTGLQIKVTLEGAKFNGPFPVPGFAVGAAAPGWLPQYAAGGTTDTTILQYRLAEPTAPITAIGAGIIGSFAPFSLKDAPGDVFATVELIDPVTGTGLHRERRQIVKRVDGIDFECAANTNADKIDVGTNATFPTAKTGFVPAPWPIGGAINDTADLGTIGLDILGYVPVATDKFVSTIGGNFAGFTSVFLATDNTCATPLAAYTINAAKTEAKLDVLYNTLVPNFGAAGGTANLCVTVNGTTQIAAQQFTVLNGLNTLDTTEEVCSVAPIAYNGSVVRVYNINPAGNAQAQSFLRVINPSTTPGKVTIMAWDDNGNARGPVTFTLAAKNSRQLNSEHLENGGQSWATGTLGDGAGKWRLEVTGEFQGMRVQSLNRNVNDGTVTNLTDADGHGEQAFNALFD